MARKEIRAKDWLVNRSKVEEMIRLETREVQGEGRRAKGVNRRPVSCYQRRRTGSATIRGGGWKDGDICPSVNKEELARRQILEGQGLGRRC